MKIIITLLLLLLVVATVGWNRPAYAEEPSAEVKALARKAFDRGTAYYQKDEYDKAIEQFDIGYRLIPNPLFLYNIAQAHRLSGRPEKALEFYRRYLRESPDAQNRDEVKERIATLEKQLGTHDKQLQLIVPSDIRPDSPEPNPPGLLLTKGGAADAGSRKRSKTWPIIVGVIGGAAAVGLAVGLGVGLGTRPAPANVFQPVTP